MSDLDESFGILRDIKPDSFEPQAKKVTDSINCEELAAASAYMDPEQPPVPPTPVHNKSWLGVYLISQHIEPECKYLPPTII